MKKHWTFRLYINIDNDHRLCHYFDRRPFGHDQGHWRKEQKMCPFFHKCFLWRIIDFFCLYTKITYDLMFVMILTQSHIIKFKVFGKHIKLPGLYLFKQDTLDVLTLHKDYLRPECVSWIWLGSVLQVQGRC